MRVFWEQGPASTPDIHAAIQAERKASYSTVKTIIGRLEEKGAVSRSKQYGRTIVYAAAIEPETMSKFLLSSFIKRLFGGKPRRLITQLLKQERLDDRDIELLEKLLQEQKDLNAAKADKS